MSIEEIIDEKIKYNQIYNKDCIKGLNKLDDSSIDLVVTDPPYLIQYKTNRRKDKNHRFCQTIDNDNDPDLIKNIMPELYRVLKDNTALYMFCSQDTVDFFKKEVSKSFKIKNIIIWVKNNWTAGDLKAQYGKQYEMIIYANKGRKPFNGKRLSDIWNFNKRSGKKQLHQNQKPVELIERIIKKSSNEKEVVLDPFIGSGTTCIACKKLNRQYLGFELDNETYKIAKKRINEMIK